MVMDLVQRTFKVCDEALQRRASTARDLDGVILVGGPTRLPIDPQLGDALLPARSRRPHQPRRGGGDGRRDPGRLAGRAGAGQLPARRDAALAAHRHGRRLTEPIIERTRRADRAHARLHDGPRRPGAVKIRVYQGESRKAEGNELLGEFEFSGFVPRPRGEVTRSRSRFEINTDGIVNVSARDPRPARGVDDRVDVERPLRGARSSRSSRRGARATSRPRRRDRSAPRPTTPPSRSPLSRRPTTLSSTCRRSRRMCPS